MSQYKVGVFGSASGSEIKENTLLARTIGKEIALHQGILCSGACPGLPHEAAMSSSENKGLVMGYSPAINSTEHLKKFGFPVDPYLMVYTGMGLKGRNLICTRSSDAGIFISGRFGTMNEFTLMYDEGEGKVIGLLEGSGGFVDSVIIPSVKDTEKKSKATIVIESDPIVLVQKVFEGMTGINF